MKIDSFWKFVLLIVGWFLMGQPEFFIGSIDVIAVIIIGSGAYAILEQLKIILG